MPAYGRVELVPGLGGPSRLVAADLNGDGRPDLIATVNGQLLISLNAGSGLFGWPVVLATGGGPFAVGDFDGDGHVDLAFANFTTNATEIYSGNGDGTFRRTAIFPVPSGYLADVAAGDFDGDGKTDLAILLGGSLEVHLQRNGALSENSVSSYANGSSLDVIDFNRDGRADLLVHHEQFGGSSLYPVASQGDGTFSWAGSGIGGGGYHLGYTLAIGDIDGDGFPDVAVVDWGNGYQATLHVFRNEPAVFVESAVLTLERTSASVMLADFDGDGRQEIAVVQPGPNGGLPELLVYRSPDASRLFLVSRQTLPLAASVTIADVDGDGVPDLILWSEGNIYTPFLMRGACPAVPPPPFLKAGRRPSSPGAVPSREERPAPSLQKAPRPRRDPPPAGPGAG
jgi:hypothetical protein